MKIYLATPYSHEDKNVRLLRFHYVNQKASDLMSQGHIIFSPISHSHPIAIQCGLPLGFDFWEKFDRSFIDWCDELWVYRQSGWKDSGGVKAEIEIAKELGKGIKYV